MTPPEPSRTLCLCREAAEILGCTMGRVRQLCRKQPDGSPPVLWSRKLGARAMVLDRDQVERLAESRQQLRADGKAPGPSPKGFRPDT